MSIETLPISLDPSFEVVASDTPSWLQHEEESKSAKDFVKVGVLLGAGFIVWRSLVKRSMPELTEPTSETVFQAFSETVKSLTPIWLKATIPPLRRAYELGSHGSLEPAELEYLANVYSNAMGEYVNQTSAKSLMEGFNALVNQKWSPHIAYRRAVEGIGLTSDGMKTYITSMENLDKGYLPNALTDDPRINATLTKMLGQRSLSIGENEAYTAQEMGRQLMWMKAAEEGLVSKNSRRMWRTAKDERVCPVCAPLNEEIVGLYEKFDVNGEEHWNPVLHPNCRCWVELIEPEYIEKAYDPTKTPRGGNPKNRGQFSRSWGPKAQVKEQNIDPIVDEIIASALKENKVKEFKPKELKTLNTMNQVKSFQVKDLKDLKSPKAESLKSFKPLKRHEVRPLVVTPGLTLPQQIVMHYKKKPPLNISEYKPAGEVHIVDGLYAFDYQSSDYKPGEVITGSSISHSFVDDQELAAEMANDYADNIKGAIYDAMSVSPQIKRRYVDYLHDELAQQLYDMDPHEIAEIALQMGEGQVDVYDDRDAVVSDIREYLIEPQITQVPQSHDENAANIISEHGALMQAHDEALMQVMTDLLDNNDPSTSEAARHLIPEIFPRGLPYDEGASTVRALVPTIYVVENPQEAVVLDAPEVDMGFSRSRQYLLDGEFEVTHSSYDENPTIFPQVQMVYLRRKDDVSKSFDPFGVLHLAVKRVS